MIRNRVLACALLALVLALAACSKDKTASTPTPGASTTPAAPRALNQLSLVYVDSSRGLGSELYVASYDGSTPRRVASLPAGNRVLDVRGKTAVAASLAQLTFIDLATGVMRSLTATDRVGEGRFLDAATFVYTTGSGCGPGGSKSSVVKVDVATLAPKQVASPDSANLNIIALESPAIALVLRGCDVGVHTLGIYDLNDGHTITTVTADGCGGASLSLAAKKVLVSWRFCTPPAGKTGIDYSIYDYAGASVTSRDVTAPSGGANLRSFIARPGQAQVALGTSMAVGTGPGSTRASGLWLLDLNTAAFTSIAPGEGAEQYPIAWTPDGRYLLAGTVQAQGVCSFSYVDATTKESKPIVPAVTLCGVNGEVIGWTALN